MQTNFFSHLATLALQSDLRLTIRHQPTGQMLVTIQMVADKKEQQMLPSLTLTHSPKDLDAGFFEIMQQRPAVSSNSFNPTEAMIKQWDNLVQRQPTSTLSKKPDATHITAAKKTAPVDKKYQAQMNKVEKLEKEGSYRQAYGQIPKEADFPAQAEAIKKKKSILMAIIDGGGLFGNMEPVTPAIEGQIEAESETNEDEEDLTEEEDSNEIYE